MPSEDDRLLAGGNMGPVYRRGDSVVRPAGAWTPAVHRLLTRLHDAGVDEVPRVLPSTEEGTEVLTFLDGDVPAYPLPAWVWEEAALRTAARLLRRIHDATATGPFDGPWRSAVHEPVEVLCHNDFAPYNLVFRDGDVVGAIDWDYASPGPRIWDLAYLAYQLVPLTSQSHDDGFTADERRCRLDLLVTVYGLRFETDDLLRTVRRRLTELATFSDAMAVELSKPELADHAAVYRADAAAL